METTKLELYKFNMWRGIVKIIQIRVKDIIELHRIQKMEKVSFLKKK